MADIIKVSATSLTTAVAGAIAGVVRERGHADVQAIGASAVNQAVKAIAISRGYLLSDGIDIVCVPVFVEIDIGGQERTALRFSVIVRSRRDAVTNGEAVDEEWPEPWTEEHRVLRYDADDAADGSGDDVGADAANDETDSGGADTGLADDPAGEAAAGGDQSSAEQAGGDQPDEEQSGGEQSGGEQSGGGQPDDDSDDESGSAGSGWSWRPQVDD